MKKKMTGIHTIFLFLFHLVEPFEELNKKMKTQSFISFHLFELFAFYVFDLLFFSTIVASMDHSIHSPFNNTEDPRLEVALANGKEMFSQLFRLEEAKRE